MTAEKIDISMRIVASLTMIHGSSIFFLLALTFGNLRSSILLRIAFWRAASAAAAFFSAQATSSAVRGRVEPARAVGAPPVGIALPAVRSDLADLRRADIGAEHAIDHRAHAPDARESDLAALGTLLLLGEIFLADLAERPVEHRHVVLDERVHLPVLLIGAAARIGAVGGLEGDRLVAVLLRHLHPAIPVVMRHVGAAENDQAGLELFLIGHECHRLLPSVQIPCRFPA